MQHRQLLTLSLSFVLGACSAGKRPDAYPAVTLPSPDANRVVLRDYSRVDQRIGDQEGDFIFTLALSGGGERSANFAIGVMLELEQSSSPSLKRGEGEEKDLLGEVDFISTVSGGGMAAGALLTAREQHLRSCAVQPPGEGTSESTKVSPNDQDILNCMASFSLAKQLLSPPSERGLLDWLTLDRGMERGYFWPFANSVRPRYIFTYRDAGDSLQDAFDRSIFSLMDKESAEGRFKQDGESMDLSYSFWPAVDPEGVGETSGKNWTGSFTREGFYTHPMWVANAANARNGDIFPVVPGVLEYYGIRQFNHRGRSWQIKGKTDRKEAEVASVYEMPMAVGLKASAAFPIYHDTTLKAEPGRFIHLTDGGTVENLGLATGLDLSLQALNDNPAAYSVILVVDAFVGEFEPFETRHRSRSLIGRLAGASDIYLAGSRNLTLNSGPWVLHLPMVSDTGDITGRYYTLRGQENAPESVCSRVALVALNFKTLAELESFDLYERVSSVGTTNNVYESTQRELIRAGETVVRGRLKTLEAAIAEVKECAGRGN